MRSAALRLMRPANIVTAYADILAGYAAGVVHSLFGLFTLLIATTGLYGGGVVLNDVFDAPLDAVERPERPIPSGHISRNAASWLGGLLLAIGVAAAFVCSWLSGIIAAAIAIFVIVYDGVGKHRPLAGPFNMGLCRGLNLLLGLSLGLPFHPDRAFVACVTLCYIAGVTVLSRGEVFGGTRIASRISGAWLATSVLVLMFYVLRNVSRLLYAAPFLVLLFVRVAPPFARAFRTRDAAAIRRAIKAGVLSLIVLDAALAALFRGWWYGVAVLALYLPAMLLSKLFAVT